MNYSLNQLFEKFPGGIKIPRIQRGYVQGRNDEKGAEIRANFVPALVSAVFHKQKLSLDFIYGVEVPDRSGKPRLFPLDGQQRLSTLFLMAWLCGKWDPKCRFEYESRRIPTYFVKGLLETPHTVSKEPSKEIEDAKWFFPVWKNDPSVAGMLRMLDALHNVIVKMDCQLEDADFEQISFSLHRMDGDEEAFDHIFRKMNARGKELSPWENMKAMLDKHLPESLKSDWQNRVDGVWDETIWKHSGEDIVKLNNSMEKIVRVAYARFAGPEAQGDSLWKMEERLCGNEKEEGASVFSPKMLEDFYQTAMRYFKGLNSTAGRWTQDRTANALWSRSSAGTDFWTWLANGRDASVADQLRMAFLTEPTTQTDSERRRRVLLNLLDASTGIDEGKFSQALSAGLDFLAGKLDVHDIEGQKAGYSTEQLADEERKWEFDPGRIVAFEKDDLAYCGSLRFIGWSAFKNENDIKNRLDKIRDSIKKDWVGCFCDMLVRFERGSEDELKSHVKIPLDNLKEWGKHILSTSQGVKAIAEMETNLPAPLSTSWIQHFENLARDGKLGNNHGLRAYDGWTYLVADTTRSEYSIRLDYNECESKNRQLLERETIYYEKKEVRNSPRAAKVSGYGYDVWEEAWYTTCEPPIRRIDGKLDIIATTSDAPAFPLDSIEKWKDAFCKIDGDSSHWKTGRSAQSLAEWVLSGEACKTITSELNTLTEFKDDHVRCFDRAVIECPCPFDSYPSPRQQDMGIWGRTESGKIFFIGVEAKVDEPFGQTLREAIASAKKDARDHPASHRETRIRELSNWFGIATTDDCIRGEEGNFRYQLFHFAKGTADVPDVDFRIMLLVTFQTDMSDPKKVKDNIDDWNRFLKRFFVSDSGESHLQIPSEHNALIALKIEVGPEKTHVN